MRLLLAAGAFFGEPADHPWRVFFITVGLIGVTTTLGARFVGSGFHGAVAWHQAIAAGCITGLLCGCIATLLTVRQRTGQ